MDVLITIKLRAGITDLQQVSDAVFSTVEKMVTAANIGKEKVLKTNTILSFEALEIRPDRLIKKEFTFPNDLDKIKP